MPPRTSGLPAPENDTTPWDATMSMRRSATNTGRLNSGTSELRPSEGIWRQSDLLPWWQRQRSGTRFGLGAIPRSTPRQIGDARLGVSGGSRVPRRDHPAAPSPPLDTGVGQQPWISAGSRIKSQPPRDAVRCYRPRTLKFEGVGWFLRRRPDRDTSTGRRCRAASPRRDQPPPTGWTDVLE